LNKKRSKLFALFLIVILTLSNIVVFAAPGDSDDSTTGGGWTPKQGDSGVVQTGDDEFDYITDAGGTGGVIVTDELWRYNKIRTVYVLNVSIFS
jgi:hypothetical protein